MRMHLPMRIGCASMRIDAHHPHIVQKMTSHFLPINCHFGSVFPNPWAQSPISWPIYWWYWRFLWFIFSQSKVLIQDRQSWNKRRSASTQCLPHPKLREERNTTDAPCVTTRSILLLFWKFTFLFTPEKSPSAAISVNTNEHRVVPSRYTCGHIQERSLSLACSVSSPAQKLVTSNNTC